MSEIEHASTSVVEQSDLESACEQLREAHQEMTYFERRLQHATIRLIDARTRMDFAIARMESLLATLRKNDRFAQFSGHSVKGKGSCQGILPSDQPAARQE